MNTDALLRNYQAIVDLAEPLPLAALFNAPGALGVQLVWR